MQPHRNFIVGKFAGDAIYDVPLFLGEIDQFVRAESLRRRSHYIKTVRTSMKMRKSRGCGRLAVGGSAANRPRRTDAGPGARHLDIQCRPAPGRVWGHAVRLCRPIAISAGDSSRNASSMQSRHGLTKGGVLDLPMLRPHRDVAMVPGLRSCAYPRWSVQTTRTPGRHASPSIAGAGPDKPDPLTRCPRLIAWHAPEREVHGRAAAIYPLALPDSLGVVPPHDIELRIADRPLAFGKHHSKRVGRNLTHHGWHIGQSISSGNND